MHLDTYQTLLTLCIQEIENKELKRFKTYVEFAGSSLRDKNGQLLQETDSNVAWYGGGTWTLDWIQNNLKAEHMICLLD